MVLMQDDYGAKCLVSLAGEDKAQDLWSHPLAKAVPRSIPFAGKASMPGFATEHYVEFLTAVMGEGPYYGGIESRCFSDINISVPFMEAILIGAVAVQVPGSLLTWDCRGRRFDSGAANALLRPYIREGFEF